MNLQCFHDANKVIFDWFTIERLKSYSKLIATIVSIFVAMGAVVSALLLFTFWVTNLFDLGKNGGALILILFMLMFFAIGMYILLVKVECTRRGIEEILRQSGYEGYTFVWDNINSLEVVDITYKSEDLTLVVDDDKTNKILTVFNEYE